MSTTIDLDVARLRTRAHTSLLLLCEAAIDKLSAVAAKRGIKLSCAVDARAHLGDTDQETFHRELVDLLETAISLSEEGGRAGIDILVDDRGELMITAWNGRPSTLPAWSDHAA